MRSHMDIQLNKNTLNANRLLVEQFSRKKPAKRPTSGASWEIYSSQNQLASAAVIWEMLL